MMQSQTHIGLRQSQPHSILMMLCVSPAWLRQLRYIRLGRNYSNAMVTAKALIAYRLSSARRRRIAWAFHTMAALGQAAIALFAAWYSIRSGFSIHASIWA